VGTARSGLAQYYDWLARYERLATWLKLGNGHDALTVHRLLLARSPGVAAAHVVHERILEAVGPIARPRVIDAGCGAGGTIFFLRERLGGEYDGLTLSPAQHHRATREAGRRNQTASCRFHLRSYESDLGDLARGGVDMVVAIESLAHSPNPARTIANLSRALTVGGRLVIVDDVPDEALPEDDEDFIAFRNGWQCAALARFSTLVEALRDASLSIEKNEDLTAQVTLRRSFMLEQLVRANRYARRLLRGTRASVLVDALAGGLMLERLYHRGLMQYRLLVARRLDRKA
jgi:cyclopropane fatty-acyl-phospholipid synthase-like methyltransferase